jgi:SAM-dependent methyltransferase
MNYFSYQTAAARYARGRPYFHPWVIERIKAFLSTTGLLSSALDVGCGTGLSTVALREIARQVVGVDASSEMIALAPQANDVHYVVASAENLPFNHNGFDLITLSQVFHWLDRDKFLTEARRVLRPSGWLVTYDHYFIGEMLGNPEFRSWYREVFLERYPIPSRAEITFTAEDTRPYGFDLLRVEWHEHMVAFTLRGLEDYLVTQSNVIAIVEGGKEDIEETRKWLAKRVKLMFGGAIKKEFIFNTPIWYLQLEAVS